MSMNDFTRAAQDLVPDIVWGLNDELLIMLKEGMNAWSGRNFHLKTWNLSSCDGNPHHPGFPHELGHLLILSALVSLQFNRGLWRSHPGLAKKLGRMPHSPPQYQGDMRGENINVPLDASVLDILIKKEDPRTLDLSDHGFVMKAIFSGGISHGSQVSGYYNSSTVANHWLHFSSAFYLGRISDETMFEVRKKFHFDAADLSCKVPDSISLQYGAEYVAPDGTVQTLEPMINPSEDPDIELIVEAMMPGLRYVQERMIEFRKNGPYTLEPLPRDIGQAIDIGDMFRAIFNGPLIQSEPTLIAALEL